MITTITRVRVVPSPGRGVWGHPIPDEVHVHLACGHSYWWPGRASWAPLVGEKRHCDEQHEPAVEAEAERERLRAIIVRMAGRTPGYPADIDADAEADRIIAMVDAALKEQQS